MALEIQLTEGTRGFAAAQPNPATGGTGGSSDTVSEKFGDRLLKIEISMAQSSEKILNLNSNLDQRIKSSEITFDNKILTLQTQINSLNSNISRMDSLIYSKILSWWQIPAVLAACLALLSAYPFFGEWLKKLLK
jgi:pectate lyase